jgi:hypothetical protein
VSAKKVTIVAGAAVLIYSLIVYPVQLANGVQAAFGWLTTGVESAITFARTVFT